MLADGDDVRVTTSTGYEVEGSLENHHANLDDEKKTDREVYTQVLIGDDEADELGSTWGEIRISAHRRRSGWTDLEAVYVSEVDDDLTPTEYESLGVVETIERID